MRKSWQLGFARLACIIAAGLVVLVGLVVLILFVASVLNSIAQNAYQNLVGKFYQVMVVVLVAWVVGGLFIYACTRKSPDIYYRP